jgi:hypothetical protein
MAIVEGYGTVIFEGARRDSFVPDKYQWDALKTWYGSTTDPRNPAMKLAGETGELVDAVAKYKFKPNTPPDMDRRLMDEAGDAWYYWRILAAGRRLTYQSVVDQLGYTPKQLTLEAKNQGEGRILALLLEQAQRVFMSAEVGAIRNRKWSYDPDPALRGWLLYFTLWLEHRKYHLEIIQFMNVRKLSGAGNHGWHPGIEEGK